MWHHTISFDLQIVFPPPYNSPSAALYNSLPENVHAVKLPAKKKRYIFKSDCASGTACSLLDIFVRDVDRGTLQIPMRRL